MCALQTYLKSRLKNLNAITAELHFKLITLWLFANTSLSFSTVANALLSPQTLSLYSVYVSSIKALGAASPAPFGADDHREGRDSLLG